MKRSRPTAMIWLGGGVYTGYNEVQICAAGFAGVGGVDFGNHLP